MTAEKKNQVFNPYLPSYEYVPDGEPHVFGDRVYIYGSHDRFDGEMFCLNDYICYSADVKDLKNWRYEGVIFKKEQDPRNCKEEKDDIPVIFDAKARFEGALNPEGIHALWAPDVVKGLDGRYYLYYCLDYLPEIGVAVCDTPAGKYEFLGFVHYADGELLGRKDGDKIQFDPGIFIDDDHEIYLYSGNAPMYPENDRGNQGSQVMRLCEDMLTLKEAPKHLLPSIMESEGTGFEGHEFFEASSIRKINGKYYFVYSSVLSRELCYAISEYPDRDYKFAGTLVDIGDVGMSVKTVEQAVNCLGNTHGGIEKINGEWYIFYHRQSNRTQFSRQGCAEKIQFLEDGSFSQTEVTSCGLNGAPLEGKGTYPAYICCHLTGKNGIIVSDQNQMKWEYPFLTQDMADHDYSEELCEKEKDMPIQYIANITDGTTIGYKYFDFKNVNKISIKVRGRATGKIRFGITPDDITKGEANVRIFADKWVAIEGNWSPEPGVSGFYMQFTGSGFLDMIQFSFEE